MSRRSAAEAYDEHRHEVDRLLGLIARGLESEAARFGKDRAKTWADVAGMADIEQALAFIAANLGEVDMDAVEEKYL